MGSFGWDEEWAASFGVPSTGVDPKPPSEDVFQMREQIHSTMKIFMDMVPPVPDVQQSEPIPFTSFDGTTQHITRFGSKDDSTTTVPSPAIVYIHGGGFIANSVSIFSPRIAQLAHGTGLPVYALSFRLSPEYTASTILEDVLAGLRHVAARAEVDERRVVLVGDSSGGGQALGAVLMARDRGYLEKEFRLARVVLVMPALDHKTRLEEGSEKARFLTWTSPSNEMVWNAYLWGHDGKSGHNLEGGVDSDIAVYASPSLAKDLTGLPPTFIEVGNLDLFYEEDMEMARSMMRDGVDVELHVWPGVPHGFDGGAGTSSLARRSMEVRFQAIRRSVGLPVVKE